MLPDHSRAKIAHIRLIRHASPSLYSQRHFLLPKRPPRNSSNLWKAPAVLPLHRTWTECRGSTFGSHYPIHIYKVFVGGFRRPPRNLNYWWWEVYLQTRVRARRSKRHHGDGNQQYKGHHCFRLWPRKNIHLFWCWIHPAFVPQCH